MSDHDPVNKPSHYMILPGVEVYDVRMGLLAKMRDVEPGMVDDWSRAWEYLTRMWGKNGLEDAKKSRWYLDKLIGKLEAEANQQAHMDTLVGQFLDAAADQEPSAELIELLRSCPDCGAPGGDLHYVLCPRLPMSEAHAQAVEEAFAEHARVAELKTEIETGLREDEQPDFDEARADIIGQNGNDGEHYEETTAPEDPPRYKIKRKTHRAKTDE